MLTGIRHVLDRVQGVTLVRLPRGVRVRAHNGPAALKSRKCKIDQKSGSSVPGIVRKAAQRLAGKVAWARGAGPSHFSGQFVDRCPSEMRPERTTFLIDFAFQ